MLLKIVILIIIILILITVLHRYKNISEKFEDIRKDILIKNVGKNRCLYSEKNDDIFNKSQEIYLGDCDKNDKRFYWKIGGGKIKNKLSRKCISSREDIANQYICEAPIGNIKWEILENDNGKRIFNKDLCLSSKCDWKSCLLEKCNKSDKNQSWKFIDPNQKDYVYLKDKNGECLNVEKGNPLD